MDDSGLNKNPFSVAVDTVDNARPLERDVSTPGSIFRAAFPGESLPSYVHFHTEIDGISVIRLDVEVILARLEGGATCSSIFFANIGPFQCLQK